LIWTFFLFGVWNSCPVFVRIFQLHFAHICTYTYVYIRMYIHITVCIYVLLSLRNIPSMSDCVFRFIKSIVVKFLCNSHKTSIRKMCSDTYKSIFLPSVRNLSQNGYFRPENMSILHLRPALLLTSLCLCFFNLFYFINN
jgi:hypothetical protein